MPATFPAGQLIPGWVEALQMMKVGDEWELVIPSALGYGEQGAGGVIPPNQTLVFQMALLNVQPEGAPPPIPYVLLQLFSLVDVVVGVQYDTQACASHSFVHP